MEYRGRVAIVTGASSGIGKEVAIDMAKRGVKTIAVARRGPRLEETLVEMRRHLAEAEIVVGDVAELATAKRTVEIARSKWGRLDFLVNNAGISKRKHLLTVTPEEAEQTIRINLIGPIFFILESLPMMVAQREGYVVNVSSIAGKIGNPREVIYSASKFGLAGLSETMYHDLHRRGVHTVLVNPGPIATEIWEKIESPPAYKGKFYPASDVSRAIFDAIEKRKHECTVPRHMAIVPVIKALFPPIVRWGTDRFDPDRPEDLPPPAADLDRRRGVE
ncbi:MAG: SDR family NAD(P)-dependent oxidoreductase [Candidatus Binatia bacterium]